MDQDSAHMVAASKVPMLKLGEYEIWRMRIEQYIQMIDYALWEVIENGATLPKIKIMEGVIIEMPITSAEDKALRRLEVKARSTLMMGIDNAQIIHVFYGVICIYSIISHELSILNSLKLLAGSLEDIPRIDTTKSNTYTIKNASFKKRSTIKLYVPNVRRTCHLCATLTFKSKKVNIALTQQVRRIIFCVRHTSYLI
ncbi:hypothetical protein Tco_1059432 [Tanacetum coccineum]